MDLICPVTWKEGPSSTDFAAAVLAAAWLACYAFAAVVAASIPKIPAAFCSQILAAALALKSPLYEQQPLPLSFLSKTPLRHLKTLSSSSSLGSAGCLVLFFFGSPPVSLVILITCLLHLHDPPFSLYFLLDFIYVVHLIDLPSR